CRVCLACRRIRGPAADNWGSARRRPWNRRYRRRRAALGGVSRARAYAVSVANALLEHAAVFGHVDVAFGAGEQQIAVALEVAVPFHQLPIVPRTRVFAQLVVGHAIEVRAQVEAGLVHALVGRILLEVPGGLLHGHCSTIGAGRGVASWSSSIATWSGPSMNANLMRPSAMLRGSAVTFTPSLRMRARVASRSSTLKPR